MTSPAAPPAASPPAEFSTALEEFLRALRRARGRAAHQHAEGLTLAQFLLLDVLTDEQPRTVSQLAEAGGIAQPTATRMLEGLASAGVVERAQAPHDRRCVLISLTADGAAKLAAKSTEVRAARERLASSLTAQEQRDATALLRRMSVLVEDL